MAIDRGGAIVSPPLQREISRVRTIATPPFWTIASIGADNRRIAGLWRTQAEFNGAVPKSNNHAGSIAGESGGYFVAPVGLNGRRAYLKPTKKHAYRRAAREKIAADLAFDLGVDVPPANLAISEVGGKSERFVSISLVMFPHQFSWGEMRELLPKDTELSRTLRLLLPKPCARALAFNTWVDQTDHNDHPANIQFGYEGRDFSKGRFVFLDYAFSMGVSGQWTNGGWQVCGAAPFPPLMNAALDPAELSVAIDRIEKFTEDDIKQVVGRVPWQYLMNDDKVPIVEGLVGRRGLVRAALASYL